MSSPCATPGPPAFRRTTPRGTPKASTSGPSPTVASQVRCVHRPWSSSTGRSARTVRVRPIPPLTIAAPQLPLQQAYSCQPKYCPRPPSARSCDTRIVLSCLWVGLTGRTKAIHPPACGASAFFAISTLTVRQVDFHFRLPTFRFQLSLLRRIIARLFVMGGTIAKLSTGLATLSGHRPQQRPEGTLGQHAKAPPHNAPHLR